MPCFSCGFFTPASALAGLAAVPVHPRRLPASRWVCTIDGGRSTSNRHALAGPRLRFFLSDLSPAPRPSPGLQAWQKPKLRPLAQAAAVEAHRQPGAPLCTVGGRRKEHGLPLNEASTGDPLRGQLDGANPVLDFTSSPAPPPPQPTHTNPLGKPSRRFSTGSFDTLITQPKQAGIDPHER